jgi:tetratricopeptide (TPR) repeat protein
MAKRPAKKSAKRAPKRAKPTRAETPKKPTPKPTSKTKTRTKAKTKTSANAKATPKPKTTTVVKAKTRTRAAKPTKAKLAAKPKARATSVAKPANTKPSINLLGTTRDHATVEPVPGAHALHVALSDVVATEVEAEAALEAGDTAHAIASYTRLIDTEHTGTSLASHLVARGRAYYRAGDYEAAIGDFERGLAIEPHFPDLYFDKGKAELQAGRVGDADASFTYDLELDPSPISFYNRHLARKALGDRDGALADLDRALEGMPDEVPLRVARSMLRASGGDLEGGLADAEAAVKIEPHDISLHERCGRLALGLGRCERAAEAFGAARRIAIDAGDVPDVEHLSGEALAIGQLGRHADALTLLDRALVISPDNATLHCNRGWMFHLAGRDTEALADLDRAIALDGGYAKALQNRAAIYTARGDRSRALADYRKLDELGHDVTDAIARLVAP